MTDIGYEIISQTQQMIKGLLDDYQREIDTAYLNSDPDLTVSISVKYAPDKDGIKITAAISFTKEKVKNSISVVIDPKQLKLFKEETKITFHPSREVK